MVFRSLAVVLAAVMIGSSAVRADDFPVPKQTIVGADQAQPLGELVKLSVSPAGADKPATLLSTSEVWKVYDLVEGKLVEKPFFEGSDAGGTRYVLFGSGIKPKKLFVSVAVTHLYVVKDGDRVKTVATKTAILTAEVQIGDSKPEPVEPDVPHPPKPVDPPAPAPSLPSGQFGLAQFLYDAISKGSVKDPARIAKAHASAWKTVVKSVEDGKIRDLATALKETSKAVKGLGENDTGWKTVGDAVESKLFELYQGRKLNNAKDLSVALTELSQGAEAIK